MRHDHRVTPVIKWLLAALGWIGWVSLLVFASSRVAPVERLPDIEWVEVSVGFLQAIAPIGIILAVGLQSLSWVSKRSFGDRWVLEAIQESLSEIQRVVYGEFLNDAESDHRVTLYQRRSVWERPWERPIAPPWRKRLVAIARSGFQTQRSIAAWRIDDSPAKCRGIAGRAWNTRGRVLIPAKGEEPLPRICSTSPQKDVETYALRTNVDPKSINTKKIKRDCLARSFAAFRVMVDQRPWGVLVLDSVSERGIEPSKLDQIQHHVQMINILLRRSKI